MSQYVLDANALYTYFRKRQGFEIVASLFHDALASGEHLLISSINWGEVYCAVARQRGYREADRVSQLLALAPLTIVDADRSLAEFAGRIKAGYGLHYADCFAAALAGKTGVVVTADVKDFKKVPWVKTLALPAAKSL
jgi:predicted nucleic acid-binding protein